MKRLRWMFSVAALALLLVGAGTAGSGLVAAQGADSTPAACEGRPPGGMPSAEQVTGFYQDFVAKLATNLGETDSAVVDTAIRESLKQVIDERQAAGDLPAEQAEAIKERIDDPAFPLSLQEGMPMGPHGPGKAAKGTPGAAACGP
jgi:hypothetical protein